MSGSVVGILLAAGQSRRFGGNKLLHPVNNTPMLMLTAQQLASVLPESIVVINQALLSSHKAQLEQLGMRVVVNEQAKRGMGSSIACGIRASQDAAGWLIALADMPYIKTETITRLSDRLKDGAELVAPVYQQQRGHPVGFGRGFRDELLALHDDVGARHIIVGHQQRLELIASHDAGVIIDIDQASDIA